MSKRIKNHWFYIDFCPWSLHSHLVLKINHFTLENQGFTHQGPKSGKVTRGPHDFEKWFLHWFLSSLVKSEKTTRGPLHFGANLEWK